MAPNRKQISLISLLVITTLLAIITCVFALPGGFTIYLPILVALLLCLGIWNLSAIVGKSTANRVLFWSAIVVLSVGAFFYATIFSEAFAQYQFEVQMREQRNLVDAIRDPESFEALALAFHSKAMRNDPTGQVFVSLDDETIPREISELNPTEISAGAGHLLIRLKPNGMILVYPKHAKMPKPEGYKQVSNRVLYYESSR